MFAKVIVLIVQGINEDLAVEDINTHRPLVELGFRRLTELLKELDRNAQLIQERRLLWFLLKPINTPVSVAMHDAETGSNLPVDRCGAQGDVGPGPHVFPQQVQVVHPVKLVAAQDEKIFVGTIQEVAQILAYSVGCALVPAGVLRGLLGGEYLNEAPAEMVELVTGVDVLVQRDTVELR